MTDFLFKNKENESVIVNFSTSVEAYNPLGSNLVEKAGTLNVNSRLHFLSLFALGPPGSRHSVHGGGSGAAPRFDAWKVVGSGGGGPAI